MTLITLNDKKLSKNLDLCRDIKEIAYLEGDFITRAGKKTNYYIDKYLFETNPAVLDAIATELCQLFPAHNTYDRIAAPELGAVPLAALVAVKLQKPFLIVKKAQKEYGTQRLIEGKYNKNEKVVVLEDVVTTGGAVLKACDILLDKGLDIVSIIGTIDREEGGAQNIMQKGFAYQALITTSDLKNC
jgi:orotate phosphoribosyltransferase